MANHVININPLNPISIWRAEREYKRLWREFDRKVDIFIERVAEYGREHADEGFGGAVSVTLEPIDNGYAIVASGQAVGFLEFGAGATVSPDDFAAQVSYEVRPGSWSETHAQMYSNTLENFGVGWWVFGGVVYYAVQPTNAMQWAWEAVTTVWRDIAEEVFS